MKITRRRLFEIAPCCSEICDRNGWEVKEYKKSFNEDKCLYRGHVSHLYGRDKTTALLRSLYPGCKVRVTR